MENTPPDQPVKKLAAHDGRLQFVYREGVHRDARGELYDLVICSWCQKEAFITHRKQLMRAVKGGENRKLPNCGCRIRDRKPILADYMTEMTLAEIALKHGCSETSVTRFAREAGLNAKPKTTGGAKVVTDYRIIAEILLTCDTLKTAGKLGVSRKRVRDAINKYMTKITKPPGS